MESTKRELHRQMNHEILAYTRSMQQNAPVTDESIHAYLTSVRHLRVIISDTRDRLAYLVSAGYLKSETHWQDGGEMVTYTITAMGMDMEDGELPPPNWKPGN